MGFLSQMPKALTHCCDSTSVNYNFCKHCLSAWYTQTLCVLCRARCINLWVTKVWRASAKLSLQAQHWQNFVAKISPFLKWPSGKQKFLKEGVTSSKIKTLHLHSGKNTLFVKTDSPETYSVVVHTRPDFQTTQENAINKNQQSYCDLCWGFLPLC